MHDKGSSTGGTAGSVEFVGPRRCNCDGVHEICGRIGVEVEMSGRSKSASGRTLSGTSAFKQGLGAINPYLGAADMTGLIRSQEGDELTDLLRRPRLPAG
jgi:hypothetical protein